MVELVISNRAFDRYFRFLKKLDKNSKKRLIYILSDSLQDNKNIAFDPESIYGQWDDSRDSDEIIKSILESRTNSNEIEKFE